MACVDCCNYSHKTSMPENFKNSRQCDFTKRTENPNLCRKPIDLNYNLNPKSGNESCSPNDCLPKIERLIQTFKEAQSLVDAVGNVPAVVGLKPIVPNLARESSHVRYNGGGETVQIKTQAPLKEGAPKATSAEKNKKQEDDGKQKVNDGNTGEIVNKPSNEDSKTATSKNKQKKQINNKSNSYSASYAEVDNPYNVVVSKDVMSRAEQLAMYNTSLIYGHRKCTPITIRVPYNMGWLWNSSEAKHCKGKTVARLGWRPGAIGKYVYKLLKTAKTTKSGQEVTDPDALPPTPKGKSKIRAMKGTRSAGSPGARGRAVTKDDDKLKRLPPTLHVHRKDGTYYITMYPVVKENEACKSPEMVEPLKFKVTKNEDVSRASSTTASDMEIEFSPPAAILECAKKPERIDETTQVEQKEIVSEVSGKATAGGEKRVSITKKSKKAPK